MCTINDSHVMYGSWDMECSGQNFFSLLTVFCSFTKKKKSKKLKILKKWKNRLKISSLYTNVSKVMIICYTVPVILCVTDVILIFYFELFLPFHPPNNPKNQKFRKMKRKQLDISSIYTCVPKINIIWCTVPKIWCVTDRRTDRRTNGRTDRRTHGQKKWHIEVGTPPKMSSVFNDVFLTWSSSKIWFFFHKSAGFSIVINKSPKNAIPW